MKVTAAPSIDRLAVVVDVEYATGRHSTTIKSSRLSPTEARRLHDQLEHSLSVIAERASTPAGPT